MDNPQLPMIFQKVVSLTKIKQGHILMGEKYGDVEQL